MKAKLIKTEGLYILKDGLLHVVGVDDKNLKERLNCNYLLFTKNCQAIERGYDLDELAENYCNKIPGTLYEQEIFKEGFQKALSILGDKKFTYNQMVSAITESSISHRLPSLIIQELQQTEWDVEIVEEDDKDVLVDDVKEFLSELGDNPKLDADGCLILKTFKSE